MTGVIEKFTFGDRSINVYGTPKEPLFKAIELGDLLGLEKIRNRLNRKDKNGNYIFPQQFKRPAPVGGATFVTEQGVYFLAFRSDKPEAINFTIRVTDIIKDIRLKGQYVMPHMKPIIQEVPKLIISSEHDLHCKVVDFLRVQEKERPFLHFNPTLGECSYIHQDNYGYHKGTFDIEMKNITSKYVGLALELKTPNGKNQMTDEQKLMFQKLKESKWKVIVSNDYTEIISKLTKYILNVKRTCPICLNKGKLFTPRGLKCHLTYKHKKKQLIKLILKTH